MSILADSSIFTHMTGLSHLLLTYALKSSVLLLAALVIAKLCRNRSASVRHGVWSLALVGILTLPIASLVVPSWNLSPLPPVLPDKSVRTFGEELLEAGAPAYFQMTGNEPEEIDPQASTSVDFGTAWPSFIAIVWFAGALAVTTRASVGFYRTRKMIRHAVTVEDNSFNELAACCALKAGIARSVRLLRSGRTAIPLTAGWLRPVIVVPEGSSGWTERRKELVLLHEFAHIRRRDVLCSLLALVTSVVNWFNPLAWLAIRQLSLERERASDDRVLDAGMRPSEYAHHLLEIARSLTQARWASPVEVTMAQKKSLEGRLLAILDNRRHRHTLKPISVVLMSALIAALTIPVASFQTWAEPGTGFILQESLAATAMQPWTATLSEANTSLLNNMAVNVLREESDSLAVTMLLEKFNHSFQNRDLDGMLACLSTEARLVLEQSYSGGIDTWKRKTARKYYNGYTNTTIACKKLTVTRKINGYYLHGPTAVLGVNQKGMNILIENKERVLLCKQEEGQWRIAKTNFLK